MVKSAKAEIGNWYKNEQGDRFEVVAIDGDSIGIQYYSGDVDELDADSWIDMAPLAMPAPEDWSGPFDDLLDDDFGDTEKPRHPEDWSSPLDSIEAENEIDWED